MSSNETETLSIIATPTHHPGWAVALAQLIAKDEPIEPADLLASFSPKRQSKITAAMESLEPEPLPF